MKPNARRKGLPVLNSNFSSNKLLFVTYVLIYINR